MKKIRSEWKIRLPQFAAALLQRPESLRIGCSRGTGGWRLAVVRVDTGGKCYPVAWGSDIPALLRMVLPMTVYADLGMTPVHVVTADLDGEDPDAWIDRNEESLTPAGFTVDRIITESDVEGDILTSVTVTGDARDGVLKQLNADDLPAGALLPPLAGLASVYGEKAGTTFVLWYLTGQGSVLGKIENGTVQRICHFWADTEAFITSPKETTTAAAALAASLSGDTSPCQWLLHAEELITDQLAEPEAVSSFAPAPAVFPGLPTAFYAACGNACCGNEGINLLPFQVRQQRKSMTRLFAGTMKTFRVAGIILALLGLVAAGYIGISRLLLSRDREAMTTIDRQFGALMKEEHRRDSLLTVLRQRTGLIGNESGITRLLSELQTVFPDGVKAEEIMIDEMNSTAWKISLRAFTVSSALMQPAVERLRNVTGCGEVRVVYSEQVSGTNRTKGIRFKMETVWR